MSKLVIGTHSGNFHCDEAFACYMLRILPEYKGSKIIRSRDPKVLDTCDILVDVGGVYNPETHRYDHHQKGFTETFSDAYPTKLSSAGLVYKHFGKRIIGELVQRDEETVELIFQKLYKQFVEALDAIDNGISQYPEDIKPAYSLNTDLSSRVGRLNPAWNESSDDASLMQLFERASEMAGSEFVAAVKFLDQSWLPARSIVKKALAQRKDVHPSGEVVRLPQYTVWKKHLLDIEAADAITPLIKYVLYEDSSKAWRIQAVPVSSSSFTSRLPLPEAWRGVRDQALSDLTGIEGCIFVHAGGFIGGAKTYDSALALATQALELAPADEREGRTCTQQGPLSSCSLM